MIRSVLALAVVALLVGCEERSTPVQVPAPEELVEVAPAVVAEAPSAEIVPALPPPPLAASSTCTRDPEGVTAASELRWLKCTVAVVGAQPSSELALEFIAPGALAYERRTAKLDGSPYDTQQVQFELPVAGTMIDFSRMHGTWAANFYVDGQPLASESFEVTP